MKTISLSRHYNTNTPKVCAVLLVSPKETSYADLIGEFLYRSSQGNQYTIVIFNYDANKIGVEPVNSQVEADLKNTLVKFRI